MPTARWRSFFFFFFFWGCSPSPSSAGAARFFYFLSRGAFVTSGFAGVTRSGSDSETWLPAGDGATVVTPETGAPELRCEDDAGPLIASFTGAPGGAERLTSAVGVLASAGVFDSPTAGDTTESGNGGVETSTGGGRRKVGGVEVAESVTGVDTSAGTTGRVASVPPRRGSDCVSAGVAASRRLAGPGVVEVIKPWSSGRVARGGEEDSAGATSGISEAGQGVGGPARCAGTGGGGGGSVIFGRVGAGSDVGGRRGWRRQYR